MAVRGSGSECVSERLTRRQDKTTGERDRENDIRRNRECKCDRGTKR